MCAKRYFVDARGGIIAVRDREKTDPEYQGLWPDTPGVVKHWHGVQRDGTPCPTCGHTSTGHWSVPQETKDEAAALCERLNAPGMYQGEAI